MPFEVRSEVQQNVQRGLSVIREARLSQRDCLDNSPCLQRRGEIELRSTAVEKGKRARWLCG